MKHLKLWSILMLAVLMMPLVASCGGDDSSDGGGGETATDGDLISKAIGTWMCTESTDTQQGKSYQGMMVGKEVTINAGGTYTSTASSFGYSGTYSVSGNKITAKSDAGGTFVITVSIKNDNMTWEGTASNGVTFRYVFQRESTNPVMVLAFTKELITDCSWVVEDFSIAKGSNSSIQKGKTITFKDDGSCEAFHSMENAWRITNGRIETYYKKTNEPMYVYTLLSQNAGKLTVRMNGTLDDNLEATLTLAQKDDEPASVVTESYWSSKQDILNLRAACYSSCTTFAIAQYNMEKIRTNPTTVHSISPTNNEVSSAWIAAYQTIMRANTILDYRDDISRLLTSSEYAELIAEMTAIRAFVYYNLAILWGDVPLVKTANIDVGASIAQTAQAGVLQYANDEISSVLNNLVESQNNINGDNRFYFTRDAGYMLASELQMTLGNKSQAKYMLSKIDENKYVTTRSYVSGSAGRSLIWGLKTANSDGYYYIYDYRHVQLYNEEASGNTENLAVIWQSSFMGEYGYWAALKRLGQAQAITGCYDYELLMPIPQNDIIQNPNLKQNSGY